MDLGTAGAFASIIGLVLVLLDFVTRGRGAGTASVRLVVGPASSTSLGSGRTCAPSNPACAEHSHECQRRESRWAHHRRADERGNRSRPEHQQLLGFPIRVNAMHGHMVIDGERQEPPPTLVTTADIPYPGTRSVEVRQVVPGMRGRMSAKGMEGKFAIYAFNLSNLRFDCEARMPDGSTRDVECTPGEPHFLVRGPLQDDADFANLTRVSITFGSQRWYGADGPNEDWRGRT